MLNQFGSILVFSLVGAGFIFASMLASRLVRPHVPFREKLLTYECGEIPSEGGRINFNIRFYLIALAFIIFDVEIALMFPVAAVYRGWIEKGSGLLALWEIGVFVFILLLGLVYLWVKKDLQWVPRVGHEERVSGLAIVSKASRI